MISLRYHRRLPISATLVIAVCVVALPFVIVFASLREKKAEAVFAETTALVCREYLALKADPLNFYASQGAGALTTKKHESEALETALRHEQALAEAIRHQQVADFGFKKRVSRGIAHRCGADQDFAKQFFKAVDTVTGAALMP